MPTPPPRIIIAGGRGFIGTSLAAHLVARGYEVVSLSRTAPAAAASPGITHTSWDARSLGPWAQTLNGAAAIVNLVGRTVDCIKTPDHRDEILRSRVEATAILGRACREVASPPPVWVQMSTAHIYGDPPTVRCDEDSPFGLGLAPDVGRAWEASHAEAKLPSQRSVVVRTSFVVGRKNAGGSGALGKLSLIAKLGLGGTVGSGTQGMSWIHEVDMNRIFERAIADGSMQGAYIATAPNPVSQRDFMRELRPLAGGLGAIGIGLPALEFMVRIGAPLVLRTDPELALYGRYVLPKRLTEAGFEFRFPGLRGALQDILATPRNA